MGELIHNGVVTADRWAYAEADQPPESLEHPTVLPLDQWRMTPTQGLVLENDQEPEETFCKAPLICIRFPAFNDGRGLSLAVLLRKRFNYTGELRAVGDVHPELLHYMQRCGFDSYLLPTDKAADAALALLQPHGGYYQGSLREPAPSYRRLERTPASDTTVEEQEVAAAAS